MSLQLVPVKFFQEQYKTGIEVLLSEEELLEKVWFKSLFLCLTAL